MSGEDEARIEQKLLEEFCDRLSPNLQYEVKGQRPTTSMQAYELASNFELLTPLKSTQHQPNQDVMLLAEKLETLTLNQNTAPVRKCFYCKVPGHVIKECRKRLRDSRQWSNKRQFGNNRRYHPYSRSRSPTYERQKFPFKDRNYYHRSHSSSEREENDNAREHSPRRVHFRNNEVNILQNLLAITCLLSVFGLSAAINPLICPADAPASLWKLPQYTGCAEHWEPEETPLNVTLDIYRPNTITYVTPAVQCTCIKTTRLRSRSLLGRKEEKINTEKVKMWTQTCLSMRDNQTSHAGKLTLQRHFENEFYGTNNTLPDEWSTWPNGVISGSLESVENCYTYKTIVYTRYGSEEVNTPTGYNPKCEYGNGWCIIDKEMIRWSPIAEQQCRYIKVDTWTGQIADNVWLANSREMALSFTEHTEGIKDCSGLLVVSDQGYAAPYEQIRDYLDLKFSSRRIRRSNFANFQKESGNPDVGVVLTTQLSSALLALHKDVEIQTRRLFSSLVRSVCNAFQDVVKTTMALVSAHPTLAVRELLNETNIQAKLVLNDVVEIRPCIEVPFETLRFVTKSRRCYDKIPVEFNFNGIYYRGYLDPIDMILKPHANTVPCEENLYLYVRRSNDLIQQYNQQTGEIQMLPAERLQQIVKFGRIDFPIQPIATTLYKNRIFSDLAEIVDGSNFRRTVEAVETQQKIFQQAGGTPTPLSDELFSAEEAQQAASNLISNGMFYFLQGGMLCLWQLWIFLVCVYTTLQFLTTWCTPPMLLRLIRKTLACLIWKLLQATARCCWSMIRRKQRPQRTRVQRMQSFREQHRRQRHVSFSLPELRTLATTQTVPTEHAPPPPIVRPMNPINAEDAIYEETVESDISDDWSFTAPPKSISAPELLFNSYEQDHNYALIRPTTPQRTKMNNDYNL
ncbi:hypothetical protein DdX_17128 [Ditylenchus destructor]|uniref:CCHC-type domain-containing protein n=1 Tax=Ditylenchus destructor TaxID=166010 RepID=A0AAD4MSD9_9BILA|nr:hypothetical protein DdX_17128 [Ditylenchus destructor]